MAGSWASSSLWSAPKAHLGSFHTVWTDTQLNDQGPSPPWGRALKDDRAGRPTRTVHQGVVGASPVAQPRARPFVAVETPMGSRGILASSKNLRSHRASKGFPSVAWRRALRRDRTDRRIASKPR